MRLDLIWNGASMTRCACWFSATTHATTHGSPFSAARARKRLILKDGNFRRLVGARGFELPAQAFGRFRRGSPASHKQLISEDFPLSSNTSEHRQTSPNLKRLLHTHYTRKAFSRRVSSIAFRTPPLSAERYTGKPAASAGYGPRVLQ